MRCVLCPITPGEYHVDGGDDEQSENGADDHAGHENDSDAVASACSGPLCEDERKEAEHSCDGGHEDGSQASGRCIDHCL